MKKVAPSERFRVELDEALAGVGAEQDPVEVVGRLGARLILQQALEDEVTEFLGRARYERVGKPVSHRNGYEPRKVRTTSGTVELERPRVRDAGKLGFESRVLGKHVTRTYALESLIIGSFLRGLSTRDVEAVLEETFEQPVSSRSTVSRILEDTRERYRRWCERRLDEHDVVYCFLDAIYLKLHPDDEPAEGVLVCWGVTLEGRKVLLGLALGSRESYESWLAFGRDLAARGLRAPAMVVADGAPGLWKAARELWPQADEQRCTVHALRNVTAKLPERHHREIKSRWWKTLDEAASVADARRGLEAIVADYRTAYPSATGVIERDLDALVAHLRWPSEHRRRIRTTNLLERTFVEVRRRTKVIGRFPGETSALSLIWAVLELSSRGWRGVVMTPKTVTEIERLRRQHTPPAATQPPPRKRWSPRNISHPAELRPRAFTRKLGRHPVNACEGVKLPKKGARRGGRPKRMLFLTPQEVRTLAEAMARRSERVAVYVAAYCGPRAGELWALTRKDFDLLHNELTIERAIKEINTSAESMEDDKGLIVGPTKTHATRSMRLPRFLRDMVETFLAEPSPATREGVRVIRETDDGPELDYSDDPFDPDAVMFTTSTCCAIRHNLFYKRIFKPVVVGRPAVEAKPAKRGRKASPARPAVPAALPVRLRPLRFHDLRHTCASLSLAAPGGTLHVVKERLGHEDIRTTINIYGHLLPSVDEALAEGLDAMHREDDSPTPLFASR